MRPSVLFKASYGLCLALSLLCVIVVMCWSSYWTGGFAWDCPALQFNWHPVLMVSGLVVLYANTAVVYHVPFTWKLVHAGLMLLAILGLCAVFDFHRGFQIHDLYSLHSWVGICTVATFAFQMVHLPCSAQWFCSAMKPVHIWLGKTILILSLTSSISGIMRNCSSHCNTRAPYSSLPEEAKLVNSLGIFIVAFGMVVFGILIKKEWKRPETHQSLNGIISINGRLNVVFFVTVDFTTCDDKYY
uniref:Lysosomal membrane ascorbate-dependent ferrireductase CYB561A3 n=1 Tax=Amphiprion ocellaris TaxID=80972 RepID=A0AAQ5Z5I9_AMPOC